MKKHYFTALIVFLLLTFLAGCSNKPSTSPNEISPMNQTQEQKEIVELLETNEQEILLFEYKTEDAYKDVEFWVEVYKDGELVDKPSKIIHSRDEGNPLDGKAAITIPLNPDYKWTFIVSDEYGKSINTEESTIIVDDSLPRAFGPIEQPVKIENGKEIVLYTSVFSDGVLSMPTDLQEYVEYPDSIKSAAYLYMYIIKCKFTM